MINDVGGFNLPTSKFRIPPKFSVYKISVNLHIIINVKKYYVIQKHLKIHIPQFFIKAEVYFNGASYLGEFRLSDDTTSLATLTSKLNKNIFDIFFFDKHLY